MITHITAAVDKLDYDSEDHENIAVFYMFLGLEYDKDEYLIRSTFFVDLKARVIKGQGQVLYFACLPF